MNGHPWTNDEIEKLRALYENTDLDILCQSLPLRSLNSIHKKAKSFGLFRKFWSDEEVELLKLVYPTQIAPQELYTLFPKRNQFTIQKKANELKLLRYGKWSDKEVDKLKYAYQNLDTKSLYNTFPYRNQMSVLTKAKRLKLQRPKDKMSRRDLEERLSPFLANFNEFEIGYLSGLIDGEGHIGATLYEGQFRAKVEIANTDETMIKWLADRIPTGVYRYKPNGTSRKDTYHWILSGRKRVKQFCEEIAPFLVVKHSIAKKLSQTHADMTLEEKEEIVSFVKRFNKTGKT